MYGVHGEKGTCVYGERGKEKPLSQTQKDWEESVEILLKKKGRADERGRGGWLGCKECVWTSTQRKIVACRGKHEWE
jgi:hypothetical protein